MPDSPGTSLEDQLLAACADGDLHGVESLIRNLRDSDPAYVPPYESMLVLAARYNRTDVVRYCLDAGASISLRIMRETVISKSLETFQLLLSFGLHINTYIPWFGDFLTISVQRDDIRWATFCLEHGADPNLHMIEDSKTALAVAADQASVEMAALLLQYGALLEGCGAIVLAAEAGKTDMVKFLLERGANIDEIGLKDWGDDRGLVDMGSALHKAVTEGHTELVTLLLDHGANINLRDYCGRTPMMRAKEKNDEQLMQILKDRGAKE